MNGLDIGIIIIVLIFGIWGFKRGLILSVISLAGVIVSFIAAKLFYIELADRISGQTKWDNNINAYITDKLASQFPSGNVGTGEGSGSIQWIISKLFDSDSVINNTVNSISAQLTTIIMNIISFVIIFIAVLVLINIIGFILNKLSSLPVLSFINKLGGSAIGILKGCLLCMLIVSVVSSLTIFTKTPDIVSLFDKSTLYEYFYIGNWLF